MQKLCRQPWLALVGLALSFGLTACGATATPFASPVAIAPTPTRPAPSSPTPESEIVPRLTGRFAEAAFTVAVEGERAYLGWGTRLISLDISDPSAPAELGRSAPLPDFIHEVAISEGYAYLAAGWGGLVILDVSEPASPEVVGQFQGDQPMVGIALGEGTAYLAAGEAGLVIVDVSDPAAPRLLGALDTPGSTKSVAVSGATVYLADGTGGVWVVDVSDPANPRGNDLYELLDTSDRAVQLDYYVYESLLVHDVALENDLLYAAVGEHDTSPFTNGVRVFDVSDPARPQVVGTRADHQFTSHVAVSEGHVYFAHRGREPFAESSLTVLDFSEPSDPKRLAGYSTDSEIFDLVVHGEHLYIANGAKGLRVVDIRAPANLQLVGSYEPARPLSGFSAAVQPPLIYLADGENGMRLVDLADPADPAALLVYDSPGFLSDVLLSGTTAFLADGESGVRVLDVGDPLHPQEIGHHQSGSHFRRLGLLGEVVYAVSSIGDLHVLSLTRAGAPELVTIVRDADVRDFHIVVDRAYLALQTGEFQVADVSDPAQPIILSELAGAWDDPGGSWDARDVFVLGSTAYLAAEHVGAFLEKDKPEGSLRVIDVSDPSQPEERGSILLPNRATAVVASDSYAFVGEAGGQVTIIDVSDAEAPQVVAALDTPTNSISQLTLTHSSLIVSGSGGASILHVGAIPQLARGPSATAIPAPTPVRVFPTPEFLEPPAATPEGLPDGRLVGITDVFMINLQVGWALGGFDGDAYPRLLRTDDGGHRWREVTPPEPELRLQAEGGDFSEATLEVLDGRRAWVAYRDVGRVWRTDDGGATWAASDPLPLEGTEEGDSFPDGYLDPLTLEFVNSQVGWLSVNEAQAMMHGDLEVLRTQDGGATWQHVHHSTIYSYYGMNFLNNQMGWISDGDVGFAAEALRQTRDGGRSWQEVTSLPGVGRDSLFAACEALCPVPYVQVFRPDTVMIAVFRSGHDLGIEPYNALYVSVDGAATWQERRLPAGGGPRFSSLSFTDPEHGRLLYGLSGVLSATADGGRSWTELRQGNWGGRLNFVSPEVGWAVAWPIEGGEPYYTRLEGRVLLHTTDGGRTWEQLEPRLVP